MPDYINELGGQPLSDEPNAPLLFQLRNNRFGREALEVLAQQFSRRLLDSMRIDISTLEENQPLPYSNPPVRFNLGQIVKELIKKRYGFYTVLLNPVLSEKLLGEGKLPDATTTYEDLGVVAKTRDGKNSQLSGYLIRVAIRKGVNVRLPMVFYDLQAIEDGEFPPYGFRFDFTDDSKAYHVPILSESLSAFQSDDPELVKSGFPSELGKGERTLFTAEDGLRRFYRYGTKYLGASISNLTEWIDAGRITFITFRNPQDLEALMAGAKAEISQEVFVNVRSR